MRVLLVDNHDSFTYNLVQLLEEAGVIVRIICVSKLSWPLSQEIDRVLISPGPGIPDENPILIPFIRFQSEFTPVLGVCLGHQAIAQAFGGHLKRMNSILHGMTSSVRVKNLKNSLFEGLPQTFCVCRYHSWIVDPVSLPDCLEVTSVDESGNIMSLAHRTLRVNGVQFHPESYMTEIGARLIQNWLKYG